MFARPKPALTALGSLDNVGSSAARCRIERHKPVSKKKHRMSPEQLRLMSRRIDPTQPLSSPHTAPVKPALPVLYSPSLPTSKKRKRTGVCCTTTTTPPPPPPPPSPLLSRHVVYTPPSSPQLSSTSSNNCSSSSSSRNNNIGKPTTSSSSSSSSSGGLFQTCFDIWPGAPSLGDMTHENVKCLSELLKVRLSQAKYRLMAALEVDKTDPLYLQLKSGEDEQGWPLQTRKPEKIQLSAKRHHTFAVTVGSGRRLFKDRMPLRSSPASSSQPSTPTQQVKLVTDISGKLSVVAVTTPAQEHRKRATKKRKTSSSAAAAGNAAGVSVNSRSVTQRQQASRPFCCKHCNKRYKNRSGLTYHLGRCKYRSPPGKENIQCICGNVSQKDQTLVCCHACQSWLHRSCVGWTDNAVDKEYTCPRCPVPAQTAAVEQQQLQNLPIIDGGDQQQHLLWSAAVLEGYGSPWSMPDIPSVLFSDPLSMADEDYGLMTPTSNVSLSDTPTPQQDSCWFDFADFDNDFTCD